MRLFFRNGDWRNVKLVLNFINLISLMGLDILDLKGILGMRGWGILGWGIVNVFREVSR